ncbi:hypothetical protein N3K66_007909 [Trichothecium roseum]|uniref:Uncharacterized protein n=1 Tax=Trichothecium roseum TaxID=47278 RepID=A0ACC0USG4_9HYPO|nr:hypothetical protein N3K66_007909 [Trichothecium roseum]
MERLRLCVLWILYAGRPLSPEEYHHALWSGLALANLADPGIPKATDATVDVTIKASVTSSSKGLAEITKGSHPSVQFIHESVRDFLLKEGGLYELWPEFGLHGESLSHDKLKQCCEIYMTRGRQCQLSEGIPNNQTQLSQRLPLLEYAGKYVLSHADTAAVPDGVAQDDFLTQFNLLQWIEVHNLFEKHKIRKYSPKASSTCLPTKGSRTSSAQG